MIYEGLNINVTLLFAVAAYERVAEAFIRGLERRLEEGKSVDMQSVASFFVSRVDTEVDKRLEAAGNTELLGRAGLANARAAYRRYKAIFHGDRFAKLREAGASVQRPLWASTGVKNPKYPDTMYVDGLVGPETVNTMPMATLLAAADHANDRRQHGRDRPRARPARAGRGGHRPRRGHREAAPRRRREVRRADGEAARGHRPEARGDRHLAPADDPGADPRRARAADRRARASARWSRTSPTASGRRTTRSGAPAGQAEVAEPARLADDRRHDARGPRRPRGVRDRDPRRGLPRRRAARHGRLVARARGDPPSRSARRTAGRRCTCSTPPTPARSARVAGARRPREDAVPRLDEVRRDDRDAVAVQALLVAAAPTAAQFVAITDPGSGLADLADEHGFRRTFLNDPHIGGRYSALSYFGLVPAALMGADVRGLLDRAGVAEQNCLTFDSSNTNSGLWLGLAWGELALAGRDKLTYVVDPPLQSFGLWVEQLIAESTGKHGKGIVPIVGRAARRAGRLRRRPHVPLPAPRRPARRRHRRQGRRARQGRPPGHHPDDPRADRPRAAVLLRRVRDRGRRLGARDQPVRPAQRPGGQGRDEPRARRGRPRPAGRRRRRAARAARRAGRAGLPCDHGLRRALRRRRRSRDRAARRGARRQARRRRRSATGRASCTRPASCTRAARRPGASCSSSTTPSPTSRSPRRPTRSRASSTRRRSATSRRCAPTTCPRSA